MDTLLISVYEAGGALRELGEVEDTGLVVRGAEAVLTGTGARQLQMLLAQDQTRPFEVQRGADHLADCRLVKTENVARVGGTSEFGVRFSFRR